MPVHEKKMVEHSSSDVRLSGLMSFLIMPIRDPRTKITHNWPSPSRFSLSKLSVQNWPSPSLFTMEIKCTKLAVTMEIKCTKFALFTIEIKCTKLAVTIEIKCTKLAVSVACHYGN